MERESRATLSRYDAQTLEPLPQNRLIPRIPVSNIFAQSTRNLKDINAGYIESVSSINPGVPPFRPDPLPKVSKYEMDGMILPYDEGGKHIPGGALGMARFFFLFKKYPALLCMIVGMLLLFGKGKNSLELTNSENIMIYFAFITGIIVMIGTLHGIHNHNYSSQRAKFQTLIKIPHLAIVIIAGTVQLVYAVISYTKLSDIKASIDSNKISDKCSSSTDVFDCYTVSDRAACSWLIIGGTCCLILLAICSLTGLIIEFLKSKKIESKAKAMAAEHRRAISAYTNASAFDNDM